MVILGVLDHRVETGTFRMFQYRHPRNIILVVFGIAISLMPVLFPSHAAAGNHPPDRVPLFPGAFIARNASQIGTSRQLVFATNTDAPSSLVTVHLLEKEGSAWKLAFPAFRARIGEKGFAPVDKKREGDGKSPTGVFPLGTAFGYAPSVPTKTPYRQATDNDFWVDDVRSDDYNKWVSGRPGATSVEKMKREDDLYKLGIVIEYNMNPIVKGKGSAIFIHIWRGEGEPTLGCVAMPEDKVLKLLGWLDSAKRPLIVMGAESELHSVGSRDLVDVTEINPRIIVDMKYATEDNFTKRKLYEANICFLRRSTALRLDRVQRELEGLNLGLKVWDCYRPLAEQRALWAVLPDERYVADPQKGSRHNRGATVDVTLVDSRGAELQMPTGFDEFSARAHRRYRDLPEHVIRNRSILETAMKKAGFVPLPREWWHFDDENWSDYDVLDVPFRDLLRHSN
jgi:D-alanyl-D-alanine dipeptidase